jgi:hypothetical protein
VHGAPLILIVLKESVQFFAGRHLHPGDANQIMENYPQAGIIVMTYSLQQGGGTSSDLTLSA